MGCFRHLTPKKDSKTATHNEGRGPRRGRAMPGRALKQRGGRRSPPPTLDRGAPPPPPWPPPPRDQEVPLTHGATACAPTAYMYGPSEAPSLVARRKVAVATLAVPVEGGSGQAPRVVGATTCRSPRGSTRRAAPVPQTAPQAARSETGVSPSQTRGARRRPSRAPRTLLGTASSPAAARGDNGDGGGSTNVAVISRRTAPSPPSPATADADAARWTGCGAVLVRWGRPPPREG